MTSTIISTNSTNPCKQRKLLPLSEPLFDGNIRIFLQIFELEGFLLSGKGEKKTNWKIVYVEPENYERTLEDVVLEKFHNWVFEQYGVELEKEEDG